MSLEDRVLSKYIPAHIAIIMDGNGRWAKKRGMPRTFGHQKGSENLKNIALVCNEIGVKALSVYAFSTENWKRPKAQCARVCLPPERRRLLWLRLNSP